MTILVITTGGTIGALAHADPKKPPQIVSMPPGGKDLVREALAAPHFRFADIRCVSLEPRDSQLIDELYLGKILDLIGSAPERNILITHGTDRLLHSANFLYRQFGIDAALKNKTVILTGAMTPLANGPESDGYLNLDFSLKLLAADEKQPQMSSGIYIVLCDHDPPEARDGPWVPHLYPYEPGKYEKAYDEDGRYNRFRRVK